jgi:hypothetical protein
MDKKDSYKEKIIEQRNKALRDVVSDADLLDIDTDVDVDDYRYDTWESRFYASMEAVNIEVVSEYINQETHITLHCKTCDFTWTETPVAAKRKKCPNCTVAQKLLNKDTGFWERSAKIIADKQGKIVKWSKFNPDIPPTIHDEFVIKCHRGHLFTTSHYALRRDLWCPTCERMPDTERVFSNALSSNHVYGKRMTEKQRQKHLAAVASAKGVNLISVKQDDGKYLVECKTCKRRNTLTDRQILRNRYLCLSKCHRGGRFTLRSTEIFL